MCTRSCTRFPDTTFVAPTSVPSYWRARDARSVCSGLRKPAASPKSSASPDARARGLPITQLSSSPSFASLDRQVSMPAAAISSVKRSKSSRCFASQYGRSCSVTDGPTWPSVDTTIRRSSGPCLSMSAMGLLLLRAPGGTQCQGGTVVDDDTLCHCLSADAPSPLVEVVEDLLPTQRVEAVHQAERDPGWIAHHHPPDRVVPPLGVDHRRTELLEAFDLGVEVVGVDVEVDAGVAFVDGLDDETVRIGGVVQDRVLLHLRLDRRRPEGRGQERHRVLDQRGGHLAFDRVEDGPVPRSATTTAGP